jgi:hypothetical protein
VALRQLARIMLLLALVVTSSRFASVHGPFCKPGHGRNAPISQSGNTWMKELALSRRHRNARFANPRLSVVA